MGIQAKILREIVAACCEHACGMNSRTTSAKSRDHLGIFFHRIFARVSPVFAVAVVGVVGAVLCPASFAANLASHNSNSSTVDPSAGVRRQAASGQFSRAEDQRAALNAKSPHKRTLEDYKLVVNTYRRAELITPHANEVPDALTA